MSKDMNFFSQFKGKKKGNNGLNIYVYLVCGIVSAFIVITLVWNLVSVFLTNSEIKDYQAKLDAPEVQEKLQESDKVNQQIDSLTKYDTTITAINNAVQTHDVVTTKLLNQISSTRPSDVYLIKVDISNTNINIQGKSKNRVAIAEFEHYISKLDVVAAAYIGSIAGEQELTFDLKCVLKDVE